MEILDWTGSVHVGGHGHTCPVYEYGECTERDDAWRYTDDICSPTSRALLYGSLRNEVLAVEGTYSTRTLSTTSTAGPTSTATAPVRRICCCNVQQ